MRLVFFNLESLRTKSPINNTVPLKSNKTQYFIFFIEQKNVCMYIFLGMQKKEQFLY
jgi:hypothetical protein